MLFRYEIKKLFRKKDTLIVLKLYLVMSVFLFIRLAFPNGNLSTDLLYGDFITIEETYMTLLVIWVTVLTSFLFSIEYKADMLPVLLVTKNGRRTFASVKIRVALLLSNALYLVYLLLVLAGWIVTFGFHFDMPIVGEYYLGAYIANPSVSNMGSILAIHLIGAFLSVNVTALICLYVSHKLKKTLTTSVLIIVVSFIMGMCSKLGPLGILATLSPIVFVQVDEAYNWMIEVMDFSLSLYMIDFVVYIIVALYMVVKLRNIFKVK